MNEFAAFLQIHSHELWAATGEHLLLSALAVISGMIVAIPLGIWITEHEKAARFFFGLTSTIQTIPNLALLALMLPLFGVGFAPAVVVLFLYSLLPILRNTYTGIKGVDPNFIEAGQGMGMNGHQLLFLVKLPLAMPVIMAGIRISTVYIVSWATLAAFIGAGGLGDLIITGIQTADPYYMLAGAIPAALLAILAGWLLGKLETRMIPRGLRSNPVMR